VTQKPLYCNMKVVDRNCRMLEDSRIYEPQRIVGHGMSTILGVQKLSIHACPRIGLLFGSAVTKTMAGQKADSQDLGDAWGLNII
jgi:hypothetical protein